MPSRTSFFNPTIFGKNVRRFWPLWLGYFVLWALILPLPLLVRTSRSAAFVALRTELLHSAIVGGVLIGAAVAVFAAMLVWDFLYHARSAHGYACLPVTREGLYVSGMLSGILPLLAVNLLVALLTFAAGAVRGYVDFAGVCQWFGMVSLILLFFYGFATFCAQLTGHIVVLPLVYGVLNFVFAGAEALLRAVFGGFIYGMYDGGIAFEHMPTRWLSPVIGMLTAMRTDYSYAAGGPDMRTPIGVRVVGWGSALGYALVGLLFLALALWLLRRRKIETAGDVVAVGVLKPVFRWCMALGCALLLCAVLYVIVLDTDSLYYRDAKLAVLVGFLCLGALVGWFAAEMMMKKSFRVFRKPLWAGYGLCCLVMALCVLGMRLDVTGYERRLPNEARVDSVFVMCNGENAWVHSPEGIRQAMALHQAIIDDKEWNTRNSPARGEDSVGTVYCVFRYFKDDESVFVRAYNLAYDLGGDGWGSIRTDSRGEVPALGALLNCQEAIDSRKATSFPFTRDNLYYGSVTAALPATKCAELAGRDSVEDYILLDVQGFSSDEVSRMDPLERRTQIAHVVLDASRNGYALAMRLGNFVGSEGFYYAGAVDALANAEINYDEVFFEYGFEFLPGELWELYESCVLPDIADGTLGRVWIVNDQDYYDTVYDARIELGAREKDPGAASVPYDPEMPPAVVEASVYAPTASYYDDGYRHDSFYTVPTANSYRTVRWLTEHGVPLYTMGETDGNQTIWK
ncbi:MAG: hypothetical protein IJ705_09630 [Oscillospiraceae bacterium]|nr:hypothetical protein [Oscillospiraceae bacterium]